MKKNYSKLITLIAFAMLFFSCSSENSKNNSEKTGQQSADNSEMKSSQEKRETVWEFAKVVDEFGDELKEERAIIGIFEGIMSNSITTLAKVTVKMQIESDKKTTLITFYEYGNNIGNLPDEQTFKIKIKKEDNETEFIEQFSMNNMLIDIKGVLLAKILGQAKPLKINVDLSRANQYDETVYNFEVDPSRLSEMLDSIEIKGEK